MTRLTPLPASRGSIQGEDRLGGGESNWTLPPISTALLMVRLGVSLFRVRRMPPLSVTTPVPRAELLSTTSCPLLSVVPPL